MNKYNALLENYNEAVKSGETCSFSEYVKMTSESDPNFFRWFFDDENLADFEAGEHEEEFNEFLSEL